MESDPSECGADTIETVFSTRIPELDGVVGDAALDELLLLFPESFVNESCAVSRFTARNLLKMGTHTLSIKLRMALLFSSGMSKAKGD